MSRPQDHQEGIIPLQLEEGFGLPDHIKNIEEEKLRSALEAILRSVSISQVRRIATQALRGK